MLVTVLFCCSSPKKVIIHGTEYRVGSIIHTGHTDDELPEFSSIKTIIVFPQDSKVIFLLTKFVTIEFSFHYHAFDIRKEIQPETFLASQDDFVSYLPCHLVLPFGTVQRNGSWYVAPRFNVPSV